MRFIISPKEKISHNKKEGKWSLLNASLDHCPYYFMRMCVDNNNTVAIKSVEVDLA